MNNNYLRPISSGLSRLVTLWLLTFTMAYAAAAAPTIVSTVPAMMATGVSPSGPVVVTFSEAMDPEATTIDFFDVMNPFGGSLTANVSWSAGNTVLTATPSPAFPSSKMIGWSVDGANPNGDFLDGETSGIFTTGSGGGGGDTGHGTNAFTSFVVGKMHLYNQSANAAPVLDPEVSYGFLADASMASNRPASDVQFLMASGVQTNLQSFFEPEDFMFYDYNTNLTAFNAAYPPGNYNFTVKSSKPDLRVTVALSAEDRQPNAPQISNYDVLTTSDVAQTIPITWLPFQQGTAADYIGVEIWGFEQSTNVFSTPDFDEPGALTGTATSVQVPSGTLLPGHDYSVTVTFFRWTVTTNAANAWSAGSYRATSTDLEFRTKAGSTFPGDVIMTAPTWTSSGFSFTVQASPGQTVVIEYSTSLLPGSWQTLQTTSSPSGIIEFTDPVPKTPGGRFYRVRKA